MRVVGVPVGTEYLGQESLYEAVNGESAEFSRALVPTKDGQGSFKILCLFAAFRLSHLLRTLPLSIAYQAVLRITMLWLSGRWRPSSAVTELSWQGYQPRRKKPTILPCARVRPIWDTSPYGRLICPSEKASLYLPADIPSTAQLTSVAMPWVWDMLSLPPPRGTFHSFSNGCEQYMVSALFREWKTVATVVKTSQIEDAVGSSLAARAVGEDS